MTHRRHREAAISLWVLWLITVFTITKTCDLIDDVITINRDDFDAIRNQNSYAGFRYPGESGVQELFRFLFQAINVDFVVVIERSVYIERNYFYLRMRNIIADILWLHTQWNVTHTHVGIITFAETVTEVFDGLSGTPGDKLTAMLMGGIWDSVTYDPDTANGVHLAGALAKANELFTNSARLMVPTRVLLLVTSGNFGSRMEWGEERWNLHDKGVNIFVMTSGRPQQRNEDNAQYVASSWRYAKTDFIWMNTSWVVGTRSGLMGNCRHSRDQCQNGGTCVLSYDNSTGHQHICWCPWGYRGILCEEMTTECLDGTCDELSDCLEHTASTSSRRAAYSYTCACPDNKCGCNCQLEPQDAACPQEALATATDNDDNEDDTDTALPWWMWIVIGISVVITVLLLITTSLIIIMLCRITAAKRRNPRAKYTMPKTRGQVYDLVRFGRPPVRSPTVLTYEDVEVPGNINHGFRETNANDHTELDIPRRRAPKPPSDISITPPPKPPRLGASNMDLSRRIPPSPSESIVERDARGYDTTSRPQMNRSNANSHSSDLTRRVPPPPPSFDYSYASSEFGDEASDLDYDDIDDDAGDYENIPEHRNMAVWLDFVKDFVVYAHVTSLVIAHRHEENRMIASTKGLLLTASEIDAIEPLFTENAVGVTFPHKSHWYKITEGHSDLLLAVEEHNTTVICAALTESWLIIGGHPDGRTRSMERCKADVVTIQAHLRDLQE